MDKGHTSYFRLTYHFIVITNHECIYCTSERLLICDYDTKKMYQNTSYDGFTKLYLIKVLTIFCVVIKLTEVIVCG